MDLVVPRAPPRRAAAAARLMPTPQTNCSLTAVRDDGGYTDDQIEPGQGPVRWAGQARCYYRESRDRVQAEQGSSWTPRRELVFANGDVAVEVAQDDWLVFRRDGRVADDVGQAKTVTRRELPGMPADVQTTKVVLEVT